MNLRAALKVHVVMEARALAIGDGRGRGPGSGTRRPGIAEISESL